MKKSKLILLLFIISALFIVMTSCFGGGSSNYPPDTLTLNLYSDADSEPTVKTIRRNKFYYNLDIGVPHKTGYTFLGYYDVAYDKWISATDDHQYITKHGDGHDWNLITDLLDMSENAPSSQSVDLYACWKPIDYEVWYDLSDVDFWKWKNDEQAYTEDKANAFGRATEQAPKAPIPSKEGMDFMGWALPKTDALIFGALGETLQNGEETYTLLTKSGALTLKPVFVEHRVTVTFNYERDGLDTVTQKITQGKDATDISYPTGFYHSGEYLLGWSLSPDESVLPSGKLAEDLAFHPIWVDAKEVNVFVNMDGAEEPVTYYFLKNGNVIGSLPEAVRKYGIAAWYTDEARTKKIALNYAMATDGMTLYASLEIICKSITLNPNDGHAPITVDVYKDDALNNFDLPSRSGYELIGWCTNRDGTGEVLSLSFDNMEEGVTYYAKWVKK